MKGCELCPNNNTVAARVYCESDEARLCFDCDAKVHGANFLVARHTRVLLCRSCQSPTPWKAEGRRLGPTVSVCDRCLGARSKKSEDEDADGDDDDDNQDQESEEDDNDEDGDDDESEEGEEEQVVPGTMEVLPSMSPPPTPPASSSSSEEVEAVTATGWNRVGKGLLLKRMRQSVLLDLPSCSTLPFQEQLSCSTSLPSNLPDSSVANDEVTSDSFQPLKACKRSDLNHSSSHRLSFDVSSLGFVRPPN